MSELPDARDVIAKWLCIHEDEFTWEDGVEAMYRAHADRLLGALSRSGFKVVGPLAENQSVATITDKGRGEAF
jgi:hypothetical protein